jgi:trimeric autotransporter adhesin
MDCIRLARALGATAALAVGLACSRGVPSAQAQFVCVGNATGATVPPGTADGAGATAAGGGNVACGTNANASGGIGSTAIGNAANASGGHSLNVAIGSQANGSGSQSNNIAIGPSANSSSDHSNNIAAGIQAIATGVFSG